MGKSINWSTGLTGELPVTGDWSGSGTSKMGAFTNGLLALDVNGNYAWDPPADRLFTFGAMGRKPIAGKWQSIGGHSRTTVAVRNVGS